MEGENHQPGCSSGSPCTAVALLVQRVTTLEQILDKVINNLPPYVTAVGTIGGIIIGVLAAKAFK